MNLVPVFVAFLVAGGTASRVIAFFVFCVASVTDLLDGRIVNDNGGAGRETKPLVEEGGPHHGQIN